MQGSGLVTGPALVSRMDMILAFAGAGVSCFWESPQILVLWGPLESGISHLIIVETS